MKKSKDPAFLFYSGDFLVGTMRMKDDEIGKYIKLLCMQHQNGGFLTQDDIDFVLPNKEKKVLEKFIKEDGKYYNDRLLNEIDKRKKHSEKQRANAMKRWNKDSQCDGIPNAMPLENENENENTNENKDIIVIKDKINYKDILSYWNNYSQLKPIERITDNRKGLINARFKEYGLEKIKQMIDTIPYSPFLKGENKSNWVATFDWCFKPNNFIKVLEGNYQNQDTIKKTTTYEEDIEERVRKARQKMGVLE